ncbi:DEAD/DEAH box helicase [Amycolatopsis roodepoortensis]|uniref:DEAD/DEAH box helicase n=1 Tax=Amycolatopsis roodepoortensis TaxID=700274 RepID=UPI00214BA229|nr:DEAD/DEAH box helicase [Amycolatopsis roodepoortensis]UUV29653.1 DEAD/DEAH box helicase [Amycolatopsis roodepoortensis]
MSEPGASSSTVRDTVVRQSERVLETYRIDPGLIQEHANSERRITQGGYGDRQIYELVQNGADELRQDPGGEIAVVLTPSHLYCANQGSPITPEGTDTILRMSASRKRGGQIGRFGVGVKSVLSVSDSPEFFSTSGSFGFDRQWAEARVRSLHPAVDGVPVLRMARPLSLDAATSEDPLLADLMSWATTVVRLPLRPGSVNSLANDLARFPKEFLLFSPHVGTLTLEDRRAEKVLRRQLFQRADGDRFLIQEETADGSTATAPWRVFTRVHRPSKIALHAAGELHDRPELDLAWAVPDRKGRGSTTGTFWAYFPTKYRTTLRGIANAPWKTSEDRQNLYDGNAFNREMIDAMAALVVDSFPLLCRPEDPASYLDCAPARGREEPQWAAEDLVASIWKATVTRPSLPDQEGVMQLPTVVRLHPQDIKTEWLEKWRAYPGRPVGWVHHTVDTTKLRRSSAELICSAARQSIATVPEWLEALAADGTPAASAAALRIAADMISSNHPLGVEALKARILLTEEHSHVAPQRGRVFRRVSEDSLQDSNVYVDSRVIDEFGVTGALDTLGIHEADASGRFAAVVDQKFHDYDDARWTEFWQLSRQAGPAATLATLHNSIDDIAGSLFVRTVSGVFRPLGDSLLPGAVVPGDGSRDADIAVDLKFHSPDRQVLRELGLSERARRSVDPRREPWFEAYETSMWQKHIETLSSEVARPQRRNVRITGSNPAGPLGLLQELSDEGKAAFIANLPYDALVPVWTYQVGGQSTTRRQCWSPLLWMVYEYGRIKTSRGLRPADRCVGPELRAYADLLPVAEVPLTVAETLGLPDTLDKLRPRHWKALLADIDASTDDAFPGKAYELLIESESGVDVGNIRCRVGDRWSSSIPDAEVAVTANRTIYDLLVAESVPVTLIPSESTVRFMIETWHLLDANQLVEKEFRYVEEAEPVSLLAEFPHLAWLNIPKLEGWSAVRCTELEEVTNTPNGTKNEPLQVAIQDKKILLLRPKDDMEVLRVVDEQLDLRLGVNGCRQILERRKQDRQSDVIRAASRADEVADKVEILLTPDQLKRKLPAGLVEYTKAETGIEPDHRKLAQLAVNAHGHQLLKTHAKDIEKRSRLARQFRGDTASRELVAEMRFPEAYAGVKSEPGRSAVEEVFGPTRFPRLHEYQERLAVRMFDLLCEPTPQRGMLCLPTGAGKTRVAVESVIRVIKDHGLAGKPVLWIAQTDELCEQAVQSWKFVWEKVGPSEKLTISRLWASHSASPVQANPHLVVATDAKLDRHLSSDNYQWLLDPALVIVDEAHVSVTPTYTRILRQLGLTHNKTERPLIGLTATPFRNYNDDETRRLVDRYGSRRLDHGVFDEDPYRALQKLGMLAEIEHRELAGTTTQLDEAELAGMQLPFQHHLPTATERRLASDATRNRRIIDEIEKLPSDWPILLFSTSVEHSKLMMAALNERGIRSAAIDSATPAAERRHTIESYRSGEIRVITNYGVLAQGFDAPATRAVVVARPTYSRNVYIQMIGRGLRGPENGGSRSCLILDVKDNITNYENALSFTGLDDLWGRG